MKQCLDEALPKGSVDVMGDFAMRVSVRVACTAIGIPLEDCDLLASLVNRFFGREEGVDGMTADGLAAATELIVYGMQLVDKRRREGSTAEDVDQPVPRTSKSAAASSPTRRSRRTCRC